MLNCSVLIVDDEALVRRGISTMLDWKDLGFSSVYQAEDGLDALDILQSHTIDLVLTDIVMPRMDGLELCRQICRRYPSTLIVVLTGHQNFEYAKQSVDLGVKHYILKPVGAATLHERIQAICRNLHHQQVQKRYVADMRDKLRESMPALREKYLFRMVCTPRPMPKDVQRRMEQLGIALPDSPYLIGIVDPDLNMAESNNHELFFVLAKSIARDCLGDGHLIFDDNFNRIIILFSLRQMDGPDFHGIWNDTLAVIQCTIIATLNIEATCALSALVTSIDGLHKGYLEAITALECRYTFGANRVYEINDLDYIDKSFYYPTFGPDRLITEIKYGTDSGIQSAIEEIVSDLSSRSLSTTNFQMVVTEIITRILKLMGSLKNTPEKLWQSGFRLYADLEIMHSGTAVMDALSRFCIQVAQMFRSAQSSSSQKIICFAKTYVEHNYQNPELSLSSAAIHVSVSTGYLSQLFKKDAGQNFVKYLTDVRMRAAMELLMRSNQKTYEVAYNVGYRNAHYFSVAFKKYSGYSPSEFRSVTEKQEP